ncbi:MAG: hypothetical protein ACRC8Z_10750 [Empedobacter falsenii]
MNIKQILKQPINRVPVSAQFIQTKKIDTIQKMLIKPCKLINEFDEKGKENIELWLAMACVGTTILDTATKSLTRLKVIDQRDAVHGIVKAFKDLKNYFSCNVNYDKKELEIDDFMYLFLTGDEEHQQRIIKFQETILNKKAKKNK